MTLLAGPYGQASHNPAISERPQAQRDHRQYVTRIVNE